MTILNDEPAIISMANELYLDASKPADAIIAYCQKKVGRYLRRAAKLSNIEALQRIVCKRLNLTVHEIRSDEDITRLAAEYKAAGEYVVAGLVATQMKPNTFGMLTNLEARTKTGRTRFVTFIDCRGDKAARRVWTIWHEIAHCLTAKDQMALPLRRTTTVETIEKDPVERLTDTIAADLAFYPSLFHPVLEEEYRRAGRLSFRVVEEVRRRFNPDASFDSTLRACVNKAPSPLILLEAAPALKKDEQRLVDAGMAAPNDFSPNLRVLRSFPNELGRMHLPHVPKQWRVPQESVIALIHADDVPAILDGSLAEENMSLWSTSTGSRLRDCAVLVEAKKIGSRVIAIIELAAC
jgi:hypothetical protein